MTELEKIVRKCQRQLTSFSRIKTYLNNRGITDKLIADFDIGYGKFYNKNWIVIPIKDVNGNYLFLKLRKDPEDKMENNKYKFYPVGSQVTIFGWNALLNTDMITIAEGEIDAMLLTSRGVPTITSTAGVGTFKKEWLQALKDLKKIYIVFDLDEPGDKGANKLAQMILENLDFIKVYKITLPTEVGIGGDITDYFVKLNGSVDDLFYKHANEVKREYKLEEIRPPRNKDFNNSGITNTDIENAKQVNCSNFIKVERKTHDGMSIAFCPFHKEKVPSFVAYPNGKGWYCFGCGRGGDTIDLVMEMYSLDFKEAIKFILNQ